MAESRYLNFCFNHVTLGKSGVPVVVLLLGFCLATAAAQTAQHSKNGWWTDAVGHALDQAGTNRQELLLALDQTPEAYHEDMQFLLENMPQEDLQSLPAVLLLDNLAQACDAFEKAPWHDRVPKEIFLNEILPYACISETRDAWRTGLRKQCAPLVAACRTPGEAAQRLNETLFKLTNVRYSTKRAKADQSPLESMKSGLASCTGLSILLVDACRAVGVPARLAGVPSWTDDRGNHTWVEIWDGDWHFAGAAEPDTKGLDHGWFEHDASLAVKDVPRHAVYASSFKKTGLAYPLDWVVSVVNVTDRYARAAPAIGSEHTRLLVKVLDHLQGQRIAAKVTVNNLTNGSVHFEGTSRDESADLNDTLPFVVPRGAIYTVRAERDGKIAERAFNTGTNAQATAMISLNDTTAYPTPAPSCRAPEAFVPALPPGSEAKLKKALADFFAAPADKQAHWKFPARLEKLLRNNESAVRRAAWETYRAAPVHDAAKQDFLRNQARFAEYLSPYTVRSVGVRPAGGWPLFIAMHGGGGAPKEVNDSQWGVMQHYYRDHPEAGGYLYVALRAPNDTWNGFYDDYVYPLVDNLIRQFLLFGAVDPNKVFIMGYSHGGYGAFAIGPKEPDLFAAIHASAGAPTDGETTGKTLRNTFFTCMVGENDSAYGRIERDEKFRESIQGFRGGRNDVYPVTVKIIPGNGHTGLPDRDMIREMYPAVRDPVPRELTWLMTDKVIQDFFWLRMETPGKKKEIDATCRDNQVTVTTTPDVASATVLLDGRLVDFEKPITLDLNGHAQSFKLKPSLRTLAETMQRRGNPDLAFTAELRLPPADSSK